MDSEERKKGIRGLVETVVEIEDQVELEMGKSPGAPKPSTVPSSHHGGDDGPSEETTLGQAGPIPEGVPVAS